jgi:lipooligosaccharide transport system permease protein
MAIIPAPTLSVFEYNMVGYRRTWRGSALSSFVLPVLFVLGFGLSVGSMVNQTGKLGIPYIAFIVPGMLASSAMQLGFGEATFPVAAKFIWQRTYHAQYATPLRISDILWGDMLFMLFRVMSATTIFLAVTALFHGVQSWWCVLTIPICGLIGIAFAAPMFAVSGRVENTVYFPFLMRFVIIPMSLFAGVYFPVTKLPHWLLPLIYISPLYHGVELCRNATTLNHGNLLDNSAHVTYLLLWAAVGFWLAFLSFRRRLSD